MRIKYYYVAYTKPQKEVDVAKALKAVGITAYCPIVKEERRPRHARLKKGKTVVVSVPLYSRYIFLAPKDDHDWNKVGANRDIVGIVSCGPDGQRARVRGKEITKIKAYLKEDKVEVEEELIEYHKGDPVLISDGVLEGLQGEVLTGTGDNLWIEVLASGKRLKVSVPFRSVRKIG